MRNPWGLLKYGPSERSKKSRKEEGVLRGSRSVARRQNIAEQLDEIYDTDFTLRFDEVSDPFKG